MSFPIQLGSLVLYVPSVDTTPERHSRGIVSAIKNEPISASPAWQGHIDYCSITVWYDAEAHTYSAQEVTELISDGTWIVQAF